MMIKKIFIVILLLIPFNALAVNGDDVIIHHDTISAGNSSEDSIETDFDRFVKEVHVTEVSGPQSSSFTIYDGTTEIYNGIADPYTIIQLNAVIRDSFKIVNDSANDISFYHNGFKFKEGSNINLIGDIEIVKNGEYYQILFIEFFSEGYIIPVIGLIILWFLLLWFLRLDLKRGFKVGFIFYKRKFIGKK